MSGTLRIATDTRTRFASDRSVGTRAGRNRLHGTGEDGEIQPGVPMFGVVDVEFDLLVMADITRVRVSTGS